LSGRNTGEPAQGAFVQILTNGVVKHRHVRLAVEFRNADPDREGAPRLLQAHPVGESH